MHLHFISSQCCFNCENNQLRFCMESKYDCSTVIECFVYFQSLKEICPAPILPLLHCRTIYYLESVPPMVKNKLHTCK